MGFAARVALELSQVQAKDRSPPGVPDVSTLISGEQLLWAAPEVSKLRVTRGGTLVIVCPDFVGVI